VTCIEMATNMVKWRTRWCVET